MFSFLDWGHDPRMVLRDAEEPTCRKGPSVRPWPMTRPFRILYPIWKGLHVTATNGGLRRWASLQQHVKDWGYKHSLRRLAMIWDTDSRMTCQKFLSSEPCKHSFAMKKSRRRGIAMEYRAYPNPCDGIVMLYPYEGSIGYSGRDCTGSKVDQIEEELSSICNIASNGWLHSNRRWSNKLLLPRPKSMYSNNWRSVLELFLSNFYH